MADMVRKILAGRYRVDEFIGKGGMAEVYKVWDSERAVYLAVKVLYADLAEDQVFLRRFTREAETLSSLQHPHIVRFYGFEQDRGFSFMLMDYVEGVTLRKQIFDTHQPFSAQQILRIMRPVCSALHYAHQMGRVHCDIKPANIMIKTNGDVLVADFGISRLMESSTTTTMAGAGTPAYMAPEQVMGQKPLPQTDIYALGIVLYEMLTRGERPFTGEIAKIDGTTSEKVRWEQARAVPPSPRKNNPAISRELEQVVLKCLEKDPRQRYSSALELLQALEAALQSEKITKEFAPVSPPLSATVEKAGSPRQKPPATPQESVKPQPRKGRTGLGIAAVVGIIGLLALLVLALVLVPAILNAPQRQASPAPSASGNSALSNPATSIQTEAPTAADTPTFVTITETPSAPALTPGLSPLQAEIIEQGAAMVLVKAGEFTMGSDAGNADAKPAHQVYLDAYYLDKFEVTNSLYAACVSAGACKKPAQLDFPGYGSYYDNSKYADFPVVFVDWFRANAYCEWRDAHLPTEAQWEKAASWDPDKNVKRLYPWGDENPGCNLANFGCQFGTSKVGEYGRDKSPYGVFDMAGNVREWVADWYSGNFYEDARSRNTNTTGPSQSNTGTRVFRGGSWATTAAFAAHTFERNRQNDTYLNRDLGFRCARPAVP